MMFFKILYFYYHLIYKLFFIKVKKKEDWRIFVYFNFRGSVNWQRLVFKILKLNNNNIMLLL